MTEARPTRGEAREYAFITDENGTHAEKVCEIPDSDQWFERVWKKFVEENR